MNLGKRIKDSFAFGLFSGAISLVVFYYLFTWIRSLLIDYYGNPYLLRPPTIQLIAVLINIIIFRLLMINYKKEQTGKGILFITVIMTLGYFYLLNRFNK